MKHVQNAASFRSTARGPAGKRDNDSIAAVIVVTILHSENVSPEKLLEIIEASGEAEVLDADGAQPSLRRFGMRFYLSLRQQYCHSQTVKEI